MKFVGDKNFKGVENWINLVNLVKLWVYEWDWYYKFSVDDDCQNENISESYCLRYSFGDSCYGFEDCRYDES